MVIYLFGDRLKNLRKDNNLTQSDIAEMLNVTDATVSAWEVGKAQPNHTMLVELAKHFNVTTDYLIGNDYDKVERLQIALKEAGINDLKKAMQILEILKEGNDTEK